LNFFGGSERNDPLLLAMHHSLLANRDPRPRPTRCSTAQSPAFGHDRNFEYLRGVLRSIRGPLEADVNRPAVIRYERGVGYRLAPSSYDAKER
jgi:hypothetical protein